MFRIIDDPQRVPRVIEGEKLANSAGKETPRPGSQPLFRLYHKARPNTLRVHDILIWPRKAVRDSTTCRNFHIIWRRFVCNFATPSLALNIRRDALAKGPASPTCTTTTVWSVHRGHYHQREMCWLQFGTRRSVRCAAAGIIIIHLLTCNGRLIIERQKSLNVCRIR